MDKERRQGAVLILCVLLLLALALLAQGALLMTREELAVSRAGADLLRARAAAEGGVADVIRGGGAVLADTVGLHRRQTLASGAFNGVRYRVTGRRLSREVWLLEGRGAARPDRWVAREAWPVWSMDAAARIASFSGVVEVGQGTPLVGVSSIRVRDPHVTDPRPDPVACATWRRVRDSLALGGELPPVAAVALVDTSGAAGAGHGGEPSLGMLEADELLAAATRSPRGVGTPGPSAGEAGCPDTEAWSWGDPDAPPGAPGGCREVLPLVGSDGSLTVRGGVGEGVLVVAGDLTLTKGARFYGLVLAGGVLTLSSNARLVGLARAAGGVSVSPDAEVDASRCWAFEALAANRVLLARPHVLPTGRIAPL